MKNILKVLFFISLSYQTIFAQWTQSQFVIGTYWDPCLSSNTDTNQTTIVNQHKARFQKAKDAYFNLLTGTQNEIYNPPINIVQTQVGMDYALYIAAEVGLKYLAYEYRFNEKSYNSTIASQVINHYSHLDQNIRNALYGYNIWDEPFTTDSNNVKSWLAYFKENDNLKLSYINLRPRYGYSSDVDYENYIDLFINDADNNKRPDVIAFDHYPFLNTGIRQDYFYNLYIIRKMAGSRPFWCFPMSTYHLQYIDPGEYHLRFMAFCPLAYGAKGLIYFTYENPNFSGYNSAIIDNCDTETIKYNMVKTINHYVTNIVGPIVMNSTNIGAYHKSNNPTGEFLSTQQLINPKTPLVIDLSHNNAMVGIFKDNNITSTYYGLVVNKSWFSTIVPLTVTLKGDLRNKISLAPSVVGYTGGTSYNPITVYYNSSTNKSTFTISSLAGGEGRIFKVTNVVDPQITTSNTDYDGDGCADMSVKTNDGFWKIDYAKNGFNSSDFNLYSYPGYGDVTAHPVPGDYDGDDKADISIKTDGGNWLVDFAADGFGSWNINNNYGYGGNTWQPVPADYDGDGKTDMAVKVDTGLGYWKIDYASNGFNSSELNTYSYAWYGDASAHPVPADYDGDGKADLSIKNDDGRWLVDYKFNGFGGWDINNNYGYGGSTWHPVPADYDGDGKADMAVKIDDGNGYWKIDYASNGFNSSELNTYSYAWYGDATSHPVPSDYDGDGRADLSVKTDGGYWLVDYAANGFGGWDVNNNAGYGGTNYKPLNKDVTQNNRKKEIPEKFVMNNYPNPFNPTTTIKFSLPEANLVQLKIIDLLGREVRTIINEFKEAGTYELEFEASNLTSGVYYYRLQAGEYIETKKMLLTK